MSSSVIEILVVSSQDMYFSQKIELCLAYSHWFVITREVYQCMSLHVKLSLMYKKKLTRTLSKLGLTVYGNNGEVREKNERMVPHSGTFPSLFLHAQCHITLKKQLFSRENSTKKKHLLF